MHDENADIHVYRATDHGLVHYHTDRGFRYLVFKLGSAEMRRYREEDDYHPRLSLGALGKLIDSAEQDGLSVEITVPKVRKVG